MNSLRRYVKAVAWACPPALLVGAACGLAAVAALSLAMLAVCVLACPSETGRAFFQGARSFLVFALVVLAVTVIAAGSFVFAVGTASGVVWMVIAGGGVSLVGVTLTKGAVRSLVVKKPLPPPVPAPAARPRPVPPPPPAKVVSPPPPPPVVVTVKAKVREFVLWAGMRKTAEVLDQGNYVITGPPGRGKTTLRRLFLKPIIEEVLDPDSDSVLICFDPKREDYRWIASRMPRDPAKRVPLWLFCPSDRKTCTIDWSYDFFSPANHETFSLSMAPENPQIIQPFFENALRTIVAELIGVIQRKLGYWDPRVLMNVLSDPGFIKELVGGDKYAAFVKELLNAKAESTAQNVQMEIASKLSKWRKIAAHLSHVKKGNTLSLERFLSKRGILVIQKDDDYREQHDAMNAMLLQRLGQILQKMQADPTGKRKVYIVIDELPSLGHMKGFVNMLRELRSRGVVFLVAWQSWANMEMVWKEEAFSIQGALQNFVVLGSADPKDAEHGAKLIGKKRGWEAERGTSVSDGTNESDTTARSDTSGWGYSQTRLAGSFHGGPRATYRRGQTGFTPTDTMNVSGSTTHQHSKSRGVSHQETKSVTWRYFERDIMSPTEIMRSPWPTKEGGFHGIGYCVGEPEVCDFLYESEFMAEEGVFDVNDFIPEYEEWPSEKLQLLEGLDPLELARLGLLDAERTVINEYPTPEQLEAMDRESGPGTRRADPGGATGGDRGGLTEGEHAEWLDEFLDGQE